MLDEPTSGLDPLMEAVFTAVHPRGRAAGRSVLLSSHILAEVEKLCDTRTIIRAGRTVEPGRSPELRHLTRTTVTAVTERDPAGLAGPPGVHDLAVDGGRVTFSVDAAHLDAAVRALGARRAEPVAAPPSLEDLFLRHYGDELAEAGVR